MSGRDANAIARDEGIGRLREEWDTTSVSPANGSQRLELGPEEEDAGLSEAPVRGRPLSWQTQCVTAADLQRKTFPPVSYVVPDLIPEGLSLLAGKPKIGKSWLALDVCLAAASDRCCLGDRKPEHGDVLYCALEDNPRRLQRRIDKLAGTFTAKWPSRLTLATAWQRLNKGGVDDIREWIESVSAPRLVVLDTLAGVKPIRTTSGYVEDYESLAALHRLANDKAVAVLVLHHTRKMEADDPIDTVSGTLGLAGCADTILVLARTSNGTTLYIRGRDIEEAEHAVAFDRASCKWTILGEAADVRRSAERGRILVTLENGELALQDLVAATGMKSDNVRKLLHHMVKAGEVIRLARGTYARSPYIE
jgi:RecA-family ATPase